jgi:DNA-binding beta-propeller fold protein YncE
MNRVLGRYGGRTVVLSAALMMLMSPLSATLAQDEQPIFYPLPPDVPRLQFLKKYSSSLDVATKSKGFRSFVFGGEENEDQVVQKPYGLAMHDGSIYVVDTRGNGYGVFDLKNDTSRLIKPSGAGALRKPINITIDEDGTRYVTDSAREQVLVFNSDDKFLRAIGAPGQFKPIDVAISGDRLYVSDIANHVIHVLEKTTGKELLRFGEPGDQPGQFAHPTNLALGPQGTIYITDTSNFRLQEFDLEGEFIRAIGTAGNTPGTFARPKGVSLDRDGHIYVVDAAFQNVQILHTDGGALMSFGTPGEEIDSINLPTVVKVDYDNVSYFEEYFAPGFDVEYLVFVVSSFGYNKVVVFGFGGLAE